MCEFFFQFWVLFLQWNKKSKSLLQTSLETVTVKLFHHHRQFHFALTQKPQIRIFIARPQPELIFAAFNYHAFPFIIVYRQMLEPLKYHGDFHLVNKTSFLTKHKLI